MSDAVKPPEAASTLLPTYHNLSVEPLAHLAGGSQTARLPLPGPRMAAPLRTCLVAKVRPTYNLILKIKSDRNLKSKK
jgi:hypothetical protein